MPQKNISPRIAGGSWKSVRFLAVSLVFLGGCSVTPEAREAKHLRKGNEFAAAKKYREAVIEFKVASQNMPKDPEPVYRLGMIYLSAGAPKPALESFQKVLTLNPKHEGALYQMALVKAGSNKPEVVADAQAVLTAYAAKHSDNSVATATLGLIQAKMGNKAEAEKLVFDAARKDPSNLRAAGNMIALYAAKGDIDTAKEIARGLTDSLPKSPDAATLRAQVSFATRDFADADTYIAKALKLQRDFQPALDLRLRRELMNGNASGAEETTREISKLSQGRAWGAYGRLLFSENKVDEAMAEYRRALKEHADDPQLRDEYSAFLYSAKRTRDADEIVAGTLSKNGKDRTALLQRATSEIDRGDIEAAAKDVKTLQDLKAFSAPLSYQESRIFAARGQTVKQGDMLAEALKFNPRMLQARLELSRLLSGSGKAKTALDILNQAAPNEKQTAAWVFYRNTALMTAGDWDEARKGVDGALKVVRSPGFLYQDAVLRVRARDLAGARKSLDASFQMAPTDPLTLRLLGELVKVQKDSPKFIAMLREAIAKNPKSPELQNALGLQLEGTGD
ncbi:MAG: tetratricopeptide repeat protein, partial [Acidobacteriota bacterium]|nr:tetratricopeptide repeat protein [Acidobacteriota bacterium]